MPSTAESRALAWEMNRLSLRSTGNKIAGKVHQLVVAKLAGGAELLPEWDALVKRVAGALGIISASELHVVDSKLLIARPGDGQQPVHFDRERHRSSGSIYSCILFCSIGCYSTALPTFPVDESLSFASSPAEMQSVAHLLDELHYQSLPVYPGDIVFFRQSTPHFGVQNTMPQGNRVVLFGVLSPSSEPEQDKEQVFPWLYIGFAFDWDSREFAESLVKAKHLHPVAQMSLEWGKQARDTIVACLERFDLLKTYNESN